MVLILLLDLKLTLLLVSPPLALAARCISTHLRLDWVERPDHVTR